MLKPLLVLNWVALVSAFLAAEFLSITQNHRWTGLFFIGWFLVAELYQIWRASQGSPGGTLSENVGAFASQGVVPARIFLVWCVCAALVLRMLVISAEISGHVTQGQLPIYLDEGPLWLCCLGILGWLPKHFYHLSTEYSNATRDSRKHDTDLGRV